MSNLPKTTHQIWSCHVTLASNSENFYFSTNSVLKFRKSYQILGKLAQEQKSYRQKQIEGGKHPLPPPRAYRVKNSNAANLCDLKNDTLSTRMFLLISLCYFSVSF